MKLSFNLLFSIAFLISHIQSYAINRNEYYGIYPDDEGFVMVYTIEGFYAKIYSSQNIAILEHTPEGKPVYSGKIVIPDSVSFIDDRNILRAVPVMSIGDAFVGSDIEELTLNHFISNIDIPAFMGCSKLRVLDTSPTSSITLGYSALCASGLENIIWSDTVCIVNQALTGLPKLRHIDLSLKSVTLGDYALDGSSVDSLLLPGDCTLYEGCFDGDNSIANLIFIGSDVSDYNRQQLLGKGALAGFKSLKTLSCQWGIPPIIDENINIGDNGEPTDIFKRCELIVPMEYISNYRSAPGWRNFKNIHGVLYADFIETDPVIVRTEYFDLSGRQLERPTQGFIIRRDIMSNNTIHTSPIIIW